MDKSLLKEGFEKNFGTRGDIQYFFSPGRVNLIGEHIDYNGGLVFPCALSIGIYAAVGYREDKKVRLVSKNMVNKVEFTLNDIQFKEEDGWGNYPKGVIKYIQEEGYNLKGADIYLESTLPDGAGLSSSAALEVLTGYIMLYPILGDKIDRVWLSLICQRAENEFIGVNCGIMDQFSVAMGKRDHAILLDCNTLEYEYVPVDLKGYTLVIMNTNKKRELSESKYNERRYECEMALKHINDYKKIENLCHATLEDLGLLKDNLLKTRARHVITENQRVKEAIKFLKGGNIKEFGKLLVKSHESLKNDYEVTGLHLDTIVEAALKFEGCIGARMTGAGFGGCGIAIVENKLLEEFIKEVEVKYKEITNISPSFYISRIDDGVKMLF
ncbi:galactokinase [Caloramator australicus]|uniref:Galactokinase n=1 Tax=Caloramator australicus RC3 TaxID=857293 RepID=I7J4K1_9CLOT|nr:galactokinase [Caloramator australicus]CCJ32676.1 Galactokinase [Caloramator australicus RC3]